MFQDYSNYCIAHHLLQTAHPELYIYPAFAFLEKMDEQNHTMYIDTLITYLENEQEISQTALQLNIHKSTLVYRLQRIRDLCNLNLNNHNICTQLIINNCMHKLNNYEESSKIDLKSIMEIG